MKLTKSFSSILIILMVLIVPSVTFAKGQQEASSNTVKVETMETIEAPYVLDLNSTEVFTTKGPWGEKPSSPDQWIVTDADIAKLKAGNFSVAMCYHMQEDQMNVTKMETAKGLLESWGVKVAAVTNADMRIEKQISDIESVMAKSPDLIFVMPIDADAIAGTVKKAAAAGTKTLFMEMHANNVEEGKDYVGTVANDYYGVGVNCAHMLAKGIGYQGTVAMSFYDAAFYATNQRDDGFKDTMAKYYPNIEIVMEIGFSDQNNTSAQGDTIFAKFPDVDGLYASWDIPMEGLISSAKANRRTDVVCVAPDLSDNSARRIAEGQMSFGAAAPQPSLGGIAEARMAAYALLGKEFPSSYCVIPSQSVMKENLAEAYETVYAMKLPAAIQEILDRN